ncbi:MAG TPA: RNA-directed DNA polymerase [bacterium]|nr:RNA-directed DNA polymerase [bacterium]
MSTIFTLEKLYLAYKECKKGKKNTINALNFELNREKNLLNLLYDLQSRRYEISRHIYFIIKSPTVREIFAADFRDRIVHHLLYNELYDVFDKSFIFSSFANRQGKGTHEAVNYLRKNILEINYFSNNSFYLKLDISSFFRSINKQILYDLIEERIKKYFSFCDDKDWFEDILWLTKKIIFHNPCENFIYRGNLNLKKLIPKSKSLFYSYGAGLPIGNLTSQFFANIYLNELDHFIKDELCCNSYLRYVDDFIIIDKSKNNLKLLVPAIDNFLNTRLNLEINYKKIYLQDTRKGISFLGYFIKPTYTLVKQKVVKRFKNKIYSINKKNKFSIKIMKKMIPMINSYYGHFIHANSFNLRKHIFENKLNKYFIHLFSKKDYKSVFTKKNCRFFYKIIVFIIQYLYIVNF